LKLHIGNSAVDYHNSEDLEKLRQVFRAANRHHMAVVIHMHASVSRRLPYGREEARIFLDSLLPEARDIPVQIAHLAGAGGYDSTTDAALSVFVDAIARRDSRARRLWFDVTSVNMRGPADDTKLMVLRIRQLGVERVLFGSDAATGENCAPRACWARFRKVPLTESEFNTIAHNVAPYMK
jgi:predicted TIM-barrel fold metal-dependent hydrolase